MASTHALSGTLAEPRKQNPKQVNELIKQLEGGIKKGGDKKTSGFKCKRTSYDLAGKDMTIYSWKFADWDYKKYELPTYARGLFTYRDSTTGNHEIVVRGYDKFFNIDEINRTKWAWIRENTKPPYELTLKENGCIIFISGLSDGNLLVCSKHSTGSRGDDEASHAVVGEKWVDKGLAQVGKTRAELAATLRELNATAVAELCDDTFEEHILAYEEDKAGLYLHGLNFNLPDFATCSQAEVQKFAETWGMRKTDYFELEDIDKLKQFLEGAAETGSWDGKDVEGFVIRCKARFGPNDPTWHDWFFKYKFEEPYLMYRQWREVTKAMLSGKEPRFKKHQKITKEYLAFAKQYFQKRPEARKEYQLNHGIIALRDAFLEARGMKGSEIIRMEAEEEGVSQSAVEDAKPTKLVLVPVATIGCGKTTLAVALSRLFHWGHVQNDNITGKEKPRRFAQAITAGLNDYPVVIADRNNHQKRERRQIFEDVGCQNGIKMVALYYVHYKSDVPGPEFKQRIRKATQDRVFSRGDNHQTIQASSKPRNEITNIMEGFLKRFEPVEADSNPDWSFDTVIDLDVAADSRVNLETVVKTLRQNYPNIIQKMPTSEELDEAIKFALGEYSPTVKHFIKGSKGKAAEKPAEQQQAAQQSGKSQPPKSKKPPQTEYFSVQLPYEAIFSAVEAAFKEKGGFFSELQRSDRIQKAFHVTLIHRASVKGPKAGQRYKSMWDMYQNLANASNGAPFAKVGVKLMKVVWDGRIMAIAAELLPPQGREKDFPCANQIPHITIGTRAPEVKPKEANDMLLRWNKGEKGFESLDLGGKIVEGDAKAVASF